MVVFCFAPKYMQEHPASTLVEVSRRVRPVDSKHCFSIKTHVHPRNKYTQNTPFTCAALGPPHEKRGKTGFSTSISSLHRLYHIRHVLVQFLCAAVNLVLRTNAKLRWCVGTFWNMRLYCLASTQSKGSSFFFF